VSFRATLFSSHFHVSVRLSVAGKTTRRHNNRRNRDPAKAVMQTRFVKIKRNVPSLAGQVMANQP
jgi:hypothetical protein